jgi:hypothetical protein
MQQNFSRTDEAEIDKKRAQEEFMREQAARRRQELEGRRGLCTGLKFWHFCADKRCKRARQCAGDVGVCFNRFWPQVPEDIKAEIRQAILFMRDGMPPQQAATEARAFVAQRKQIEQETMAREAARRAAPPEPEPASAPIKITRAQAPARHIGPRVRGM